MAFFNKDNWDCIQKNKQMDNCYEVVSKTMSISNQNFFLKILVLLLFILNVYMVIERIDQSFYNPSSFSFR